MHAYVNSSNRGSADPFSLTILGFLVVSFVVGTIAVVSSQSFDIRQRAQSLYPSPTYDCRNDFEGQCVPNNFTCNWGTTITQAAGCSSGQKCVPRTSTCYLPVDTPTVCPTSCLNGCILKADNTKECIPYCTAQTTISCQYGCDPTISGGVCKVGCPSECVNGCIGGSQVCNAYCAISCPVGQACLGTSEGGYCRAVISGEQVVSPNGNQCYCVDENGTNYQCNNQKLCCSDEWSWWNPDEICTVPTPTPLPMAPTLTSCQLTDVCNQVSGCLCKEACVRPFAFEGESCGGVKSGNLPLCENTYSAVRESRLATSDNSEQCILSDGSTGYWCPFGVAKVTGGQVRCLAENEMSTFVADCTAEVGLLFSENNLIDFGNSQRCLSGSEQVWYCPFGSSPTEIKGKYVCLGSGELVECKYLHGDSQPKAAVVNPENGEACSLGGAEMIACPHGYTLDGNKYRCLAKGETYYRKEGASCFSCQEYEFCEFKTHAECQENAGVAGLGECIQNYCSTSGSQCQDFGLSNNSNTCSNGGQCCTITPSGFDLIRGECVACTEQECPFSTRLECEQIAELRQQPVEDACQVWGKDGKIYYYKEGESYRFISSEPSLGLMCVEFTCGEAGGGKYCKQRAASEADPLLALLNPDENLAMLDAAERLYNHYGQYGTQFEYIDPPGSQALITTDETLAALPPGMYANKTILFYNQRRTLDLGGFVEGDDRTTAYVSTTCDENDICIVGAEVVIHELSHTHQYEEYKSSYCESQALDSTYSSKPDKCMLLETYNTARKKDGICIENEYDDPNRECKKNEFLYTNSEDFKSEENPEGRAPVHEQMANAMAAFCTNPDQLKNEQPTVYEALKETAYEGNDCNL